MDKNNQAESAAGPLSVKKVGYKPGVYGVFRGDKATGQVGSLEDMERIVYGDPVPADRRTRNRGRILVISIFAAGVAALMFLGAVLWLDR